MKAEMVGPSQHDGAEIDIPGDVLALVFITHNDNGQLIASLGFRRKQEPHPIDDIDIDIAELLIDLALNLAGKHL